MRIHQLLLNRSTFFSFFLKSMQVGITLEELWNKMTNGGDVRFLTGREPEHMLLQIWYFF